MRCESMYGRENAAKSPGAHGEARASGTESDPIRPMTNYSAETQDSTEPRAHPDDTGVEILTGSDEDGEEIIVAGDEGKILTDGGRDTPLAGQKRCPSGHLCSGSDAYCRQCGADLGGGE